MTDRNSPVTEEELHAYADGEIPADRRIAVEAWLASNPDDAARVAEWRAQADIIRARYGEVASRARSGTFRSRQARKRRTWTLVASGCSSRSADRLPGWRGCGLGCTQRIGRATVELRDPQLRGTQRAPPVYRGGAPPDRSTSSRTAPDALAIAPGGDHAARARSGSILAQAARRPVAAWADRTCGAVHVRKSDRRALYFVLLQVHGTADRTPLSPIRRDSGGPVDRKRHRLRGKRAG